MRTLPLAALLCASALAYNPPVDTAGPITVRILEPALGAYGAGGLAELARPDAPVTVPVTIENSGAGPVRGTLRVQVIDRWSAEPASQPFAVEARGRTRLEFRLAFRAGTYNADYPVHVFAEFDSGGKRLVAHPVMILHVRQPNPPRAEWNLPWKPLQAPAHGTMGLWRVPLRRESLQVSTMPQPGAAGREVYDAGSVIQYGVRRAGREAIAVTLGPRPPAMREEVRAGTVEYPVALPAVKPLRAVFALSASGTEGALFRVKADGTTVFERHVTQTAWQDAEADLSRFGGRAIALQFEASGAAGAAYWGEPALAVGGIAVAPPAKPRALGKVGAYEVRVTPGARGLLDGTVAFGGALEFRGFRVRVLGDALEDARSASELLGVSEEPAPGRYRLRHRFNSWAGAFDLVSETWIETGALRTRFVLENAPPPKPWLHAYIEEVTAGPWNRRATRVYAGPGNVIRNPRAFQLGFDGHSEATSFVGFDFEGGPSLVEALDVPPSRLEVDPTAGIASLNTPHAQTRTYIPAADVWAAVRTWRDINGLRPSAAVGKLAGRFVFDLWSGRYGSSAKDLERAFRYGLTDSVVVWHNWQRWGYDYRLPDIYPPNPQFGTEEEFRNLVAVCRKAGVFFAPHDNYIDYYPDSEGFSYENIVFRPDGQPYKAWFNYGRLAQSYRARADRIRPFLERNVKLQRDGFAPDAYFIDVWSSMGPYDYWTQDGRFVDRISTRNAWGEAFAWIRDYLGNNAPQISEAGHDQLIGWLDGSQAQHLRVENKPGLSFVWNIACDDAERIPWFDAAHHDRFVLHGAGYPGRYDSGLAGHGIYSDDYMATEVLTGHPAMTDAPFSRDVVRKYWLLHDLMRALALKPMEGVAFADGNLHRQAVRWAGGAQVAVNRGADDWTADGHALAPYGFHARAGAVEAAVERIGGSVVEWSRSPEAVYVNARDGRTAAFSGLTTDGGFRLTRDADGVRLTPLPSGGRFAVRLRWSALPWKTAEPSAAESLDEEGRVLGSAALAREGADIVLTCEPGVFAYRLR